MDNIDKITKLLSRRTFREIEERFRKHFDLAIETITPDGRRVGGLCSEHCEPAFCAFLRKKTGARKRCLQERIRSLHMAFQTGQPYTAFCHAGILFSCIPLMHQDQPLGGMLVGKGLSEPFSAEIAEDLQKRLAGLAFRPKRLFQEASRLPIYSGCFLHNAVEFLFILVYETARLDARVIEWRRLQAAQQSQISEIIQQRKITGLEERYPFQSERQLIAKVKMGDKTGAREILNSILGSILFRNPGQLNILKVRLAELLGILSRAAAEAGADPDFLLEKNAAHINKVISLQTQEDICLWISVALNDLIDCVYAMQKPGRLERLGPALEYMQNHFQEKITLAQIAKAAHLSVSRLCHLFREQMQMTVVEYLTDIRLNRAKQLLLSTDRTCLQICYEAGFQNLSFFNRRFKKQTGLTPRQFRRQNRRSDLAIQLSC